jgi:hypothetical protein
VIASRRKEYLGLVLETTEGLAVDDPVAVVLKRGADVVFGFRPQAAA